MADFNPTLSGLTRLILVCGSREWTDKERVLKVLCEYMPEDPTADEPTVMHGNCRGADKIAAHEALMLGFWVEAHPADWKKHGKAAGPKRNREMLDRRPDLVIAFGDGRGTRDTVTEAMRRGIEVRWER